MIFHHDAIRLVKKTCATFSSNHNLNPNQSQLVVTTRSHMFSRDSRKLHVIITSFDRFIGLYAFFVIGWRDNFGVGLISNKIVLTNPRLHYISLPVKLQERRVVIQLRFSIGCHPLQLLQFTLHQKINAHKLASHSWLKLKGFTPSRVQGVA